MARFEDIYNRHNHINIDNKENINDIIYVSFLDVLKEKKVEKRVLQQTSCLCTSPNNLNDYYDKCPKCQGKGKIELFGNILTCNSCKGKGLIEKEVCPICQGKTTIIKKEKIEIKLNKGLLENPLLVIENKGINQGDLILKVDIYDKDEYLIKDDNVYSKKILYFSKKEFKNSKEVETAIDYSSLKLNKIMYEQIVVLEGKGLNGKNFYQPVRCEVEGKKGNNIYSNLIIDKLYEGVYVKKADIYDHALTLNWSITKPLNDPNYLYLDLKTFNKNYETLSYEELGDKSFDGGKNGDLMVKVFLGDYFVKDGNIYRTDEILTKSELTNNKKSIIIDNEKHLINMDKNEKYNYFLNMGKFGLINNENKPGDFYTLINKGKCVYKISTFSNEQKFYINDYKHFFNEKVPSYSNNENMEEYIEVNKSCLEVKDKDDNIIIVSLLKKEGL